MKEDWKYVQKTRKGIYDGVFADPYGAFADAVSGAGSHKADQ